MSGSALQETVCGARPADGDLAAIWRQKRWLEKVDGLVRREDCWATTRTSCAEVRWGESSSATPCAFPRLPHWEVFAVPLGVVDNNRNKVCWVFDTRLQDCVEWCVAIGLLHDMREERSDDVPTGVVA